MRRRIAFWSRDRVADDRFGKLGKRGKQQKATSKEDKY